MSMSNLVLDSSAVLAAVANSTSAASDSHSKTNTATANAEITAIEGSAVSASLEDVNSGEVAGCGGGGCLAVA